MIAVIGERWLTEFGHRLFEPHDVVRKEIAAALAAGKPVIPVLGHAGRMHRVDELPPDLAKLANCQYVRLTYRDAHMLPGLVDRLIEAVPDLGIDVREGIGDLATWNRERTSLTSSELPADLVLLGREDIVERMRSWLAGPPGNLAVQGQTTDEVAAFVATVLDRHNPHHRAVLVTSKAGWEHAAKIPPSFPAVVVSDDVPVSHAQSTRHVVIARDGFVRRSGDLVLPRVPRDKAHDAFLAQGVPPHRANEYAGLVRRSPRALTRRLSPNAPRPPWTQAPTSAITVPLALVSRWSTANQADHDVIGRITGHDYSSVEHFAESSAVSGDPLVHRSGSRWQLADPYDASSQLMAQVSITNIRQFSEAALEVLGELDPVLSLPARDVPTARINGVGRTWSSDLRQGLAHGLARLADAGTATVAGDAAENHAAHVVHQLLRRANDDQSGLLWRSLSDVLPLFAEAAPRVFLSAVRTGLRGEDPLLRVMFEDTGGWSLSWHSAHTGLLWALETIAWAREHSTVATLLLAKLAEIDPGGRLSNRPSRSLANLLTHLPLSPIPLDRRATIINQVRTRYPEVGWRLLNDLTDLHRLMYPVRPRVRHTWTGDDCAPASDSVEAYQEEVFRAVLADLAAKPRRWTEYLPQITGLPAIRRELLLSSLETAEFGGLGPEETRELWDQGIRITGRARGSADERHLAHEDIDRLSSFLARIEPASDPTRHAWLFTWRPDLPGVDRTDFEAHRFAVESLQRETLAGELARHGVDGVARLAEASERGDLVGWTLAQIAGDSVQGEVFARLGSPLAEGWIRCRAQEGGRDWAADAANALPEDHVSRAAFLLALPVDWAFEQLDREGLDVRDRFWALTPAFPLPTARTEEYLVELISRGRGNAVVDAMSVALHGDQEVWHPPAELITAAFHSLLKTPDQITSHTAYAVESLLTYMHASGHSLRQVAMWEMAFASLLHNRQPRALLELIADDAVAFVELHQFRYLPTEKVNPSAMGFFMTGERLRCVPGQTGDGVDRVRLLDWVRQARGLLNEAGLRRTGDQAIGALISAGPDGEDGAWPAEAVRDVLDLEDADELRSGFRMGLINNIGVTTRGLYDGGEQERESAAKYLAWADKVEAGWPHTAQVLRDHAASLQQEGRYWDRSAEDDHDE
ncbi:hypothetical protein [Streptoalloteichus hindustanus]|uniref:Uncharacterized protein n=1 Tax=Streptoalloteichus hindustanus TaxID=2017 RepID=A0A1M5EUW9_STRHI|nr:hypothetical protein [Streptoalloteichus hindustanus]SHF82997.1 hypothetical protein SAMN05444320_105147 [Streptoalloteichus hindustanus]